MDKYKLTKQDVEIIELCIYMLGELWLKYGSDKDFDAFFNQTMPVKHKLMHMFDDNLS